MDKAQEAIQNALEHHGIKGQRWGIRKPRTHESKGPSEVSVKTGHNFLGKASIKTTGGKDHPAHPDSVAARQIQQKLKSSGSHSLSNSEIQKLVTRSNLERQLRSVPGHGTGYEHGVAQVNQYLKSKQGQQSIEVARVVAQHPRVRRSVATAATTAAFALSGR